MSYDPRQSLPRPSRYMAARVAYETGDTVLYCGGGYTVAAILEMRLPLYPGGIVGKHYVLRRAEWPRAQFLIVASVEVEQPTDFAA